MSWRGEAGIFMRAATFSRTTPSSTPSERMLDKTTCTLRAVPGDTPSASSRAK